MDKSLNLFRDFICFHREFVGISTDIPFSPDR